MQDSRADRSLLNALAALVVKDGVGIGRLSERERDLVLGLAWSAVPSGAALRESEVNAVLKRALAGPCRFLEIDHVELRRWLVDCGWMQRDGFGREYRRVDAQALPARLQVIVPALPAVPCDDWVEDLRAGVVARREQRRRDWEARAAPAAR